MKNAISLPLAVLGLIAGLSISCAPKGEKAVLTVMNPMGQPPQTPLIPRAPRVDTLNGKTVYIVDARYPLTHQLFEELQKLLSERFPATSWVVKEKSGTYMDDDPKLWEEIKANGHAMILGVGH